MARKANIWFDHADDVLARIRKHLPPEKVRELQKIRPWRHFLTVGRQFLQMFVAGYLCWTQTNPFIWIPAAALQGVTALGFIILLHDQLHNAIFAKPHKKLSRFLGLVYAFPSAISATQFTRWHLDHHANLGSEHDDPKRAHLSPKRNARWYKLLYFTIGLLAIYAKAANEETKTYSDALRKKIRLERIVNWSLHVAIAAALVVIGGWGVMLRVHLIPLTVFFPIAFIVNRLGQHYWIDPEDPAKWGTRVDGSWLTHYLFLWSNFHMEHHYFPTVPMYNLRKLNLALRPFFEEIGQENRTYPELLRGWLIENSKAHTAWEKAAS
ncbi:MAG: fatty acid desaturase [Deltaproteobacteria bacterium]|nr:fatty acid desaturase [Deltaproteobacteria bacterium]